MTTGEIAGLDENGKVRAVEARWPEIARVSQAGQRARNRRDWLIAKTGRDLRSRKISQVEHDATVQAHKEDYRRFEERGYQTAQANARYLYNTGKRMFFLFTPGPVEGGPAAPAAPTAPGA